MRRILLVVTFLFFCPYHFGSEKLPGPKKQTIASPSCLVLASANTPGAHGAYFKTRLSVFNPTAFEYPIYITLGNASGIVGRTTLQLKPSEYHVWDDFLASVFGYTGAGAIFFDSVIEPPGGSQSYKFIVNAEVYTDSLSGRYTTVVPSVEIATAQGPIPDFTAFNIGISVNSFPRTNVGCVNVSSSTKTVHADVFNINGQLVQTIIFSLAPYSWNQLPITSSVSNGSIRWQPVSAGIFAYAVGVNNTSNDGSFAMATEYIP